MTKPTDLKKLTKAQRATIEPLIIKAAFACLRYEASGRALVEAADMATDDQYRENDAAEDNLDRCGKRLRIALEKLSHKPTKGAK